MRKIFQAKLNRQDSIRLRLPQKASTQKNLLKGVYLATKIRVVAIVNAKKIGQIQVKRSI